LALERLRLAGGEREEEAERNEVADWRAIACCWDWFLDNYLVSVDLSWPEMLRESDA
jgi:hypothetical protein